MSNRKRRNRFIAGAVAAVALVGGGSAIAASQLGSEEDQQAILDDAAEQLGVEPSELSDALKDAYKARVDAAVEAGELTQEQGDAIKERIDSGELPLLGFHRGGPHGHHGPLHGNFDAAATYLGLTEAELREQLESGQTLAEIAETEGKTVDGLEQALVDAAEEDIAAAVEAGRLTQAQADEILAGLPDRIDDVVNGTFPPGGPGHHHGPGADGSPDETSPDDASDTDGTTTTA
jgi:hypothetical protein